MGEVSPGADTQTRLDPQTQTVDAVRGWSHFALEHASVGLFDDEFHTHDGAALVFLRPGGCWSERVLYTTPVAEHFTALDSAFGAAAWPILLEHDRTLLEQRRLGSAPTGAPVGASYVRAVRAGLSESRDELGSILRTHLARLADSEPEWPRCLHGNSERAWIHLAARLGPTLPKWLIDERGPGLRLRVCERTGVVFRGTRRATIHPSLRRAQTHRLKRDSDVVRVGTRVRPAYPLEPYARAVWESRLCVRCGAQFEAQHAATRLCGGCRGG
jgi:ribosomal protein S27AE